MGETEVKSKVEEIRLKKHILLFPSDGKASVTIPGGAASQALPSVTIAAGRLPHGAIIDEVFCHLAFGSVKDTSGADNKISGDQYIQVKESVAGSYINAIKVVDDYLSIDVSEGTVKGAGGILGNIDVKGQVDGEDTYDFQWTNAVCDGASLILYDVQMVIEVRYH